MITRRDILGGALILAALAISPNVADRFARLGLIAKPVNVSDIIWEWSPGS
jgi:hypothetical protein